MEGIQVRHWYVVRRVGESNPIYFVSAFSKAEILRYYDWDESQYMIKLAATWEFLKVFSRFPVSLPSRDTLAPNEWVMGLDFEDTKVIILD